MKKPDSLPERIRKRFTIDPITQCWVWQGYRNRWGYGVLGVGSRTNGTRTTCMVHRYVWSYLYGSITTGLCVLHSCDNPPCANPAHLFLGTQADNNVDMREKGRAVYLKGSAIGTSVLTEEQVRRIKSLLGYRNDGVLARKFGVSDSLIWNIRRGISWGHIR